MPKQETRLQQALREHMDRTGESQSALSLRAGLSRGVVKHILKGDSRNPRGDTLERLARAIGRPLQDLVDPVEGRPRQPFLDPRYHEDQGKAGTEPNAKIVPHAPDLIDESRTWPATVPLYSSAQGGGLDDDDYDLQYDFDPGEGPTEAVKRPPSLANVRDLYAVRLGGNSMVPWANHGDVVLVAPHRRPPAPARRTCIRPLPRGTDRAQK